MEICTIDLPQGKSAKVFKYLSMDSTGGFIYVFIVKGSDSGAIPSAITVHVPAISSNGHQEPVNRLVDLYLESLLEPVITHWLVK